MEFSMKVAETVIHVSCLYAETLKVCTDYLTEEEADLHIEITEPDVEKERSSEREDSPVKHSSPYLESLALYRKIAEALVDSNILLVHGSVLSVDNEAYMFTAASGTGKSTHARLWREYLGDKVVMVNDDKPLLMFREDSVLACGTPWNGKHRLGENIQVPLKAICILERGETNEIREISFEEAYPKLMRQTYRPKDRDKLVKTMELVDKLKDQIRFFRLRCNMDMEAAQVAYNAMK